MMRLLMALSLILGLVLPGASAADQGIRTRLAQQQITRDFLVGAWEAHVNEHGNNTRIIWTLWANGQLAYHFAELPDGALNRGSGGTWRLVGNEVHEQWERPNGSRGAGRGSIERVDENTIKLTIVDNGHPEYKGLVRIYRRMGVPQLSMLLR